jgi:hypothetical protein
MRSTKSGSIEAGGSEVSAKASNVILRHSHGAQLPRLKIEILLQTAIDALPFLAPPSGCGFPTAESRRGSLSLAHAGLMSERASGVQKRSPAGLPAD